MIFLGMHFARSENFKNDTLLNSSLELQTQIQDGNQFINTCIRDSTLINQSSCNVATSGAIYTFKGVLISISPHHVVVALTPNNYANVWLPKDSKSILKLNRDYCFIGRISVIGDGKYLHHEINADSYCD